MSFEKRIYNRVNYTLSLLGIFCLISSIALLITFILLLTTNDQFIAFNEYSSTGKYPPIFFYVSLSLVVVYFGLFIVSIFGIWSTYDILNRWNGHTKFLFRLFIVVIGLGGLYQLAVGILSIVYTKTMQEPLREYMADNLRSNYTGGFGVGYLERQFDRSVDWVQINYQCCGVNSHEDYRNGFYYNSFNKYTIVSIVPNSCCIYRDQTSPNQPSKCQMKSINIFRKGCYDILIWWMESFGSIIGSITIVVGALHCICSLACIKINCQISAYFKAVMKSKRALEAKKKNFQVFDTMNDSYNSTINDEISCAESKT